jgi:trehalose 6-phosphate phosphatase
MSGRATRRIVGGVEAEALLAPLAETPERTALLLDVDGVLAPIVARPELAEVPKATRGELRRLAARYRLVACVSGRAGDDARRLVGVESVEVVGNHGLELDPRAGEMAERIAAFRDTLAWSAVEDKRLSLALHFREAADEGAAVAELEEVAERARAAGLLPRWGRKVLEVRPPLDTDKGAAVKLLLERSGALRGLYAGDDTTDLDAFVGLRSADLEHAVCVAVASAEGPAALRETADLVVESPEAFARTLRLL